MEVSSEPLNTYLHKEKFVCLHINENVSGVSELITADQNKRQQDEIIVPRPKRYVMAQSGRRRENGRREAIFSIVSCLRHEPCGGRGGGGGGGSYRMGEVPLTGHQIGAGEEGGSCSRLEKKNTDRKSHFKHSVGRVFPSVHTLKLFESFSLQTGF